MIITIRSKVQILLGANKSCLLAKLESYPIHVEGALCMGPEFAWKVWVHEVALPWRGFPSLKKKKNHYDSGGTSNCKGEENDKELEVLKNPKISSVTKLNLLTIRINLSRLCFFLCLNILFWKMSNCTNKIINNRVGILLIDICFWITLWYISL
jgi:hypothetical protein